MSIPRVLQPDDLAALPGEPLIVDLSAGETYQQAHLPGAVHLEYAALIHGQPPAAGLLPSAAQLQRALQSVGYTPDKTVIAYDDQGNGRASRLLWTLEAIGNARASVLDGGLRAWVANGGEWQSGVVPAATVPAPAVEWNDAVIADKEYVRANLGNPQVALLDARTPQEYAGLKSPSLRNGHIPGAVNLNWLDTMDAGRYFCLKPAEALENMLAELGIRREQEVITYCQTHHRSSHSFMMLRHLGFAKVRGYAGAWAEWGNDAEVPVE